MKKLPKAVATLFGRGALAWFLALAWIALPLPLPAQNTNHAAPAKKSTAQSSEAATGEKKAKPGPFHGKLAALNLASQTLTVGKRTFQITPETKIRKADKPARLQDGVVGEPVSGYVKPTDDGKWVATTVNFGPKKSSTSGGKKSSNAATTAR